MRPLLNREIKRGFMHPQFSNDVQTKGKGESMENEYKINYLLNVLKTNPKIVSNGIMSNQSKYNYRKDYFDLKESIDIFLQRDSDDRFYILPGLRGVGKTTILFQLFDYLVNERNIYEYNCTVRRSQY